MELRAGSSETTFLLFFNIDGYAPNKVGLLMMQKKRGSYKDGSPRRGEKDYDPEMDIGTILQLCDLCQAPSSPWGGQEESRCLDLSRSECQVKVTEGLWSKGKSDVNKRGVKLIGH